MDVEYTARKKSSEWTQVPSHDEHWDEPHYAAKDMGVQIVMKGAKFAKTGVITYSPLASKENHWKIGLSETGIASQKKIAVWKDRFAKKEILVFGITADRETNWSPRNLVHLNTPTSGIDPRVEKEFRHHAEKWNQETAHISSATELVLHPSYQRIIGLGPAVLPLIFQDLVKEPKDWFWALTAITGASPVKPEDAGIMRKMTHAWLQWGLENYYL